VACWEGNVFLIRQTKKEENMNSVAHHMNKKKKKKAQPRVLACEEEM